MPIDTETVMRTAALARINPVQGLTGEAAKAALDKLTGELANVVGYIDILAEAPTAGVEPLYSPVLNAPGPREDEPRPSGLAEAILGQAPARSGRFFSVPKIL